MQPLLCTALLLALATRAWAVDITACGQVVPRGETGVLLADLECPAQGQVCFDDDSIACAQDTDCPGANGCWGPAVRLEQRATLLLNGHTLGGGRRATIWCERNCVVRGPGSIENEAEALAPIAVFGFRHVEIYEVTTAGGSVGVQAGIDKRGGRITATSVNANGAYAYGLYSFRRTLATNVRADGNYAGIAAYRLVGFNVTTNDNRWVGVAVGGAARLTNLTAKDNSLHGIQAKATKLIASTLTGNVGFDVVSQRRPRFVDVTCDRSANLLVPGTSWGLCRED